MMKQIDQSFLTTTEQDLVHTIMLVNKLKFATAFSDGWITLGHISQRLCDEARKRDLWSFIAEAE